MFFFIPQININKFVHIHTGSKKIPATPAVTTSTKYIHNPPRQFHRLGQQRICGRTTKTRSKTTFCPWYRTKHFFHCTHRCVFQSTNPIHPTTHPVESSQDLTHSPIIRPWITQSSKPRTGPQRRRPIPSCRISRRRDLFSASSDPSRLSQFSLSTPSSQQRSINRWHSTPSIDPCRIDDCHRPFRRRQPSLWQVGQLLGRTMYPVLKPYPHTAPRETPGPYAGKVWHMQRNTWNSWIFPMPRKGVRWTYRSYRESSEYLGHVILIFRRTPLSNRSHWSLLCI